MLEVVATDEMTSIDETNNDEKNSNDEKNKKDDDDDDDETINSSNSNSNKNNSSSSSSSISNLMILLDRKHHGRRDELRCLTQALRRCSTNNRSEVVILQGAAGSGKTSLAKQLGALVTKSGGCFAVGTFSAMRQNHPDTPILLEAFRDICQFFLEETDTHHDLQAIRRSLIEKLGGDATFLKALVPKLAQVLDADDDLEPTATATASSSIGATTAANTIPLQAFPRFKGACRRFLNAVAAPNRPIVVLFDDLEHANVGCLQVITSLLTDPSSKHVLIIGTCRDAAIISESLLLLPDASTSAAASTPTAGSHCPFMGVTNIALQGLSMDNMTWWLAEVLQKPYGDARPLGDFLYQTTNGNPYHVLLLLRHLEEHNMLMCTTTTTTTNEQQHQWDYDMTRITAASNNNNNNNNNEIDLSSIDALLQNKIRCLPNEAQAVLQLAACLGNSFDATLLTEVVVDLATFARKDSTHATEQFLALFLNESLIELEASRHAHHQQDENDEDEDDAHHYRFTHNLVQETVYDMIPTDDRDHYHYAIGTRVRSNAMTLEGVSTTNATNSLLFTAMDHLNRAGSVITKPDDRAKMAKVNLDAATRSISKSAFVSAIHYLTMAMTTWIGGGGEGNNNNINWTTHYDLTLSITTKLAQAYNGFGDTKSCKQMVDLVSSKARCLEDKLDVYFTLINSLAAQGDHAAVIDFCIPVLQGLGEKFPRKLSKTQMAFQLMKTKRKLKGMSDSDILLIPEMREEKKISIMGLIAAIAHHAYFLQQRDMMFLATTRCIQLTLSHGRAGKTAYAFACYGMVHACMNNYKEAYRFGELAIKLTDITSEKGSMAQTTCIASFFCLHWERNLQELVDPLRCAWHVGNECGDIEWSIFSGVTLISASLVSGRHLFELEEEACTFCKDIALYNNHENSLRICLPLWQCTLNLLSRGREALVLTGDAMDQDELIDICLKTNNMAALCTIWYTRLQLACYFQSWNVALAMIDKLEQCRDFFVGSFSFYHHKFFESLTYIAVDRQNATRKYQSKVAKSIKELKKLVNSGTITCEPLVHLLEAEVAALQSNKNGLKKAYDEAVASAEAREMPNIRALANECAGTVFLNYDDYLSDQYLSEALEYYFQWGAMCKVEQLETDHQSLHSRPKVVTSVASSRGSRTNSTGRKSNGSKGDNSRPSGRGARGKGRVVLFK